MDSSDNRDWFASLASEARRDLVFVFNIVNRSFFGQKGEEGDGNGNGNGERLLKAAVEYLLNEGCKVGFGDPDSDTWRSLRAESDTNEVKAKHIVKMWQASHSEYKFLAFAIRP